MEAFSTIFLSVLFKILVVALILMLITKILRRLFINKTIEVLIELPDGKKERLIHEYERVVLAWRMLFWMAPLYLLVIPVVLFVIPVLLPTMNHDLFHQLFWTYTIGIFGLYIYMVEDFFYKKKLLKAIDRSTEREML
jgi:hypothetical protein